VSHPAVKNELVKELLRLIGSRLDAAPVVTEEDKLAFQTLISTDPKSPVGIKEAKVDGDWARVRVFGLKIDGYVLKKSADGWQILGSMR
jgi:hypothetical protein